MYRPPGRLLVGSLLGLFLGALCASAASPTDRTHPNSPPHAGEGVGGGAVLSIVIDDLGHSRRDGARIIALPAAVTLAILPHSPHGRALAEAAHEAHKEVMLHMPMDPDEGATIEAGPGRLEPRMSPVEIEAMLTYDLETVPHAVGVNNHMGSRLTQDRAAMQALMQALRRRGNLFFLDSRTSPHSVAGKIAAESGVPALERDVFLDAERGEDNVRQSMQRAERILATHGRAVVIGHPYPDTLAALERWLPQLAARGVRVIPLSTMLKEGNARTASVPARPGS